MKKMKLFANCIPVKGFIRSVIYDLQRNDHYLIPNSLFDILTKFEGKSTDEIKKIYENKFDDTIDDYYNFLDKREMIINVENLDLFPPLNLNWDSPAIITNAILCFKQFTYNHESVIQQLAQLGCKYIQIRFLDPINITRIDHFMGVFSESRMQDIELILPFSDTFTEKSLKYLFENNMRLSRILIYDSPTDHIVYIKEEMGLSITFIKSKFTDHSFCGSINPRNFTTNLSFFSEALNHNSCLNRKLSIDEKGYIKNCPSMKNDYGHVDNTTLLEVANAKGFQVLWDIKKDEIEVCKDCEFRYMCLDCRAYNNQDENNKMPLKCGYNPYIAKWNTQKGYISVQEWLKQQN